MKIWSKTPNLVFLMRLSFKSTAVKSFMLLYSGKVVECLLYDDILHFLAVALNKRIRNLGNDVLIYVKVR